LFGTIIIGIAVIVAIFGIVMFIKSRDAFFGIFGGIGVLVAIVALIFTTVVFNGEGEAKVVRNFDRTVAGDITEPGTSVKAPWQNLVQFDTFNQTATYAGSGDATPKYTKGEVQGSEVTAAVKGGAQANVDLAVTYNIDPAKVTDIYKQFRSQENFTNQVINNQILAVFRDIPAAYSPVEFRGEKRGEATKAATDELNKRLDDYGVTVNLVAIQDIRFTEQVEESIKQVEVAQQKEEQAQADLRATEVSAQAQVVEAQAEADANRLRSDSITPELIEANRVEAYREAAKNGGLIVVPEGSQPIVGTAK